MKKIRNTHRTYEIALTGIMLTLSMLVLFFASFTPGIELSLLALSGLLIMIVIHETSLKMGVLFFIASLILSFIIIPNKAILILYFFIFGPYTLIKSVIEKHIDNKFGRYILKLVTFNALLILGYVIFRQALFSGVVLPDQAWYILLIGAQVMLLLYDGILTLAVGFYNRKIPDRVKGKKYR